MTKTQLNEGEELIKASLEQQKDGLSSKAMKEALKAYALKKHQFTRFVTEGVQTDLLNAQHAIDNGEDFDRAAN